MKKIGITGNIAAGKSTVEKIISDYGYKVIDADNICHFALENNKDVITQVEKIFGTTNRKILGEIVFNDIDKRTELENILHPYVKKEIEKFFDNNIDEKVVFISAALLFEAKMNNMFDKIIFIDADEDIRIKRLMTRNNLSFEEAKLRIDAQIKSNDKIKLSDFVIYNNSDFSELSKNTNDVLNKIISF